MISKLTTLTSFVSTTEDRSWWMGFIVVVGNSLRLDFETRNSGKVRGPMDLTGRRP